MLYYEVGRGANAGKRLYPHRFKDGTFHVMRRKGDRPTLVEHADDLKSYLDRGYRLRMSNKDEKHSPSLIRAESILGR